MTTASATNQTAHHNGTATHANARPPDVDYESARWRIRLWVEESDIEAAATRGQMYAEGERMVAEAVARGEAWSTARQSLATYFYPRLVSVTPRGEVVRRYATSAAELARAVAAGAEDDGYDVLDWPIDFDTFRTLPEPVWDLWEQALLAANPHMRPPAVVAPDAEAQAVALSEAQKKATGTTAGS